MQRRHSRYLPFLSLLLLSGCVAVVPRYSFSPVPTSYQYVTFADGIPFVFSHQTHLVSISLPEDANPLDSEYSLIAVSVVNGSESSFVIDGRNLQITSENRRLRIVPETEIKDRINSRAAWARIANAFASAAHVAAVSMPSTTTYSGSVHGSRGFAGYSGVVTTYDPTRAALAANAINRQQAQTDQEIETVRRAQIEGFSNGFKRHTLRPTEAYFGGVYVENKQLRRAGAFRLSINVGAETHVVEVRLGAAGSSAERIDYAPPQPLMDRENTSTPAPEPIDPIKNPPEIPQMDVTATGLFKNQRITFDTKDGRRFANARVIEITSHYVIISTSDGVFTVTKHELPDEIAQWLVDQAPADSTAGGDAAAPAVKPNETPVKTKSIWERLFE